MRAHYCPEFDFDWVKPYTPESLLCLCFEEEKGMYVYIKSEPALWTVGFYDPDNKWNSESDHESPEKAAERCAHLNGVRKTGLAECLRSRKLHQIAMELESGDFGDADYNKLGRVARQVFALSGLCSTCKGTGVDGEDHDAAGEGGGSWECESCDGGYTHSRIYARLEKEFRSEVD